MAQEIPDPPRYSGFDNWTRDKVGDVVRVALSAWCRLPEYLSNERAGTARIDLDGNIAGQVTDEEDSFARQVEEEIRNFGIPQSWSLSEELHRDARSAWRALAALAHNGGI
jgi:sRNA-binding protein